MNIFKKISFYLNPFNKLGKKEYSVIFPLVVTVLSAVLLEIYTHDILKDPRVVEAPSVIIFLGFIIYFSFRDGIRGGLTACFVTIAYYFYITSTRDYPPSEYIKNIETILSLGLLYVSLTLALGGLKQKTDDLLEREANEKRRVEAIFQQIPTGIIVVDKNGRITYTNRQLETILKVRIPLGSRLGTKDMQIISEKYKNNISQSSLRYVLNTGKSIKRREYVMERKDGKKIYLQISSSPIYGSHGKIFAAATTITDITHQKELEKRKDDFVNIASHELKTPITSMKLYINSLSSRIAKNNDEVTKKVIKNIHYQTDKLQELVNDLLDVSRLQTGKMIFTKEPFLLNELLQETTESLQAFAKKQKLILEEEDRLIVYADKFRIHQVITNLITNAIKYSDDLSNIIIKIKKYEDNAVVSVTDFGIGITKEEQKRIFDHLYQVGDSKSKTFPGLGIGLYISKQIISRHKGTIWVTSEKGKGSTFSFSLPLLQKNDNYDKKA